MNFQKENSLILMVGKRKNELGGSVYYDLFNTLGANVPKPDLEEVKNEIFSLTSCIDNGLIISCHDISDGGLSSALSEMTFKNEIGCTINFDTTDLTPEAFLFSETGGFILEVEEKNLTNVEREFKKNDVAVTSIGKTKSNKRININDKIDISLTEVKQAWESGLRDKL
jgi:phosphoribosylformylglycinamidine synthase